VNELRLLIVAIPSAFGVFMALDFLSYVYQVVQGDINLAQENVEQSEQLVSEAASLRDRLISAERQAFQQYLKSPDVQTLQQSKVRLESIRQIYGKAEQRYQRRATQIQVRQSLSGF
jgi:hypothetical protein